MKLFTLYKRSATGAQIPTTELPAHRERPWHFKFEFRGQKYNRALETADADEAQKRARAKYHEIKDAIIRGEYERLDATKTRHPIHATLGELMALYQRAPGPDIPGDGKIATRLKSNSKTRANNCLAALNLLVTLSAGNATGAASGERDGVRCRERLLQTPFPQLLTASHARAWLTRAAAAGRAAKITANSVLTKAASLCGKRELDLYKETKLLHPCLAEFAGALKHRYSKHELGVEAFEPPDAELIAKTITAWEQLEDRNLFLAIGHELAFGLRVGEVAQARPSWWQVRFGTPMCVATGVFKHNVQGKFEVAALDPFYTTLRTKALARGWLKLDAINSQPSTINDFIITGSASYRTDALPRTVSDFLRTHGWQTKKTNHALRAYAGCQVAIRYSLFDAQRFLRHSSIKVTQDHYMYLLNGQHLEYLRAHCTAKWATLDQPPTLTIVEKAG